MGKQGLVLIVGGSLLVGEAVGEVGKHELYWMTAPEHSHTEIPVSDAGSYSRSIAVDSGATATAAATSTIDLLKSLGYSVPIVSRLNR